jgi:DNA-binding response OmpR family regulator
MIPNISGLEMAKEIKEINPNMPIIILSAFSDKEKLLNAIDVGVTKYFIKPFDPDELLEYIISISTTLGNSLIILVDQFIFNNNTNKLYRDNKHIILSKNEIEFLKLLINQSPEVCTDTCIKNLLWKGENVSDERLRTFIKRFRVKTSKQLIENIKGQGYRVVFS